MTFPRRLPITGWKRSVYESAVFDTPEEFLAARILDQDSSVTWWLRNAPVQFSIATPAGAFQPDFVYCRQDHAVDRMGFLEVKGDFLWVPTDSDARVKMDAAAEWVNVVNTQATASGAPSASWEGALVGDQEVEECTTLGDLRAAAHVACP